MKPKFIYAHGTSYWFNVPGVLSISQDFEVRVFGESVLGPGGEVMALIPGLNGLLAGWDGRPLSDPFPTMLNAEVWDVHNITYPASVFPFLNSVEDGIQRVIGQINDMPTGQPFALGGYSQGAAVMSEVYNELRYGTLTSRAPYFLGGVCFGNPRRQRDYRGGIGGTWSGALEIPGSTTGGGGVFPERGFAFPLLTNCEAGKWIEFTAPGDVFSSVGTSSDGLNWTNFLVSAMTLGSGGLINLFQTAVQATVDSLGRIGELGNFVNDFIDGVGNIIQFPGGGHVSYPFVPPEGTSGGTSFQLALQFLEDKAAELEVSPIVLPSSAAGWSTRLIPPSV